MITILLALLFTVGIQHPKLAADGIERQFVVNQLEEMALTDCATNPQGGNGFNGDPLTVDWLKPPEPTEGNVNSTWFPGNVSETDNATAQSMSMRVMPVDPNPNPDPNPPVPPVSTTPEPSTFAILGITAATLLFLLFGRRYGPVGIVADLANGAIHVARGNYADAALSVVGAIPGAGDYIKGVRQAAKAADKAKDVVKGINHADDAIDITKRFAQNHVNPNKADEIKKAAGELGSGKGSL